MQCKIDLMDMIRLKLISNGASESEIEKLMKKASDMFDNAKPTSSDTIDKINATGLASAKGVSEISKKNSGKIDARTTKALAEASLKKGAVEVAKKTAAAHSVKGSNNSTQQADSTNANAHDMQDAKSDFSWTSMKHPDVKYTTLVALKDAHYTLKEDYPTSHGEIDEERNFWKKNFTTGEWWDCHHTGYLNKVDGDGNVEKKIPGTYLNYVMGDEGKVNEKNVDSLVMENNYIHVMKEQTEVIDGDLINNYNKNVHENILKSQTELINVHRTVAVGNNDNLSVGKDLNIDVSGNINIKAGGTITINGAMIKLN